MRASVITESGDLDVIEVQEVPKPTVDEGEVLVAVKASAVTHTDLWIRRGIEGDPPIITGIDVAGVIEEIGEGVEDLVVGDRVVLYWNTTYCGTCEFCRAGELSMCLDYGGLGVTVDGGHAEYVSIDANHAVPLPEEVSIREAAAFPTAFGTAWRALITRGTLVAGEDVLVLGASGGVGHAAVQLASYAGCHVYACTSRDRNARRLRELGANEIIDYTAVDTDKAVRELTDKRGVDMVIDSIGGEIYQEGIRSLVRGGRFVTFGATTGDADSALLPHLFWKQLSVVGSTGCTLEEFHDSLSLFVDGHLEPVVDDVISLEEIPDAHERIQNQAVFGRVIVEP